MFSLTALQLIARKILIRQKKYTIHAASTVQFKQVYTIKVTLQMVMFLTIYLEGALSHIIH